MCAQVSSDILCLIPLRQGHSLNLELHGFQLDWWPASPSNPVSDTPCCWRYRCTQAGFRPREVQHSQVVRRQSSVLIPLFCGAPSYFFSLASQLLSTPSCFIFKHTAFQSVLYAFLTSCIHGWIVGMQSLLYASVGIHSFSKSEVLLTSTCVANHHKYLAT